jgi:capsular exopolysaccharide synthesis family protein
VFNKRRSSKTSKVSLDYSLLSSEQIRMIRMNVENALNKDSFILMVTSPNTDDEEALISSKLAIAFSEQKKRVLLVDANLRNPSIHALFDADNSKGLANVVSQGKKIRMYTSETFIENLSILPAGPVMETTSDVFISRNLQESLSGWTAEFDVVIIEAPSFLERSDTQIVAEHCDGVILVVKANKTKKEKIVKTKSYLERAKKSIVGVIYQTG